MDCQRASKTARISCIVILCVYVVSFFLPAYEDPYPWPGDHQHWGFEAFAYLIVKPDQGWEDNKVTALIIWLVNPCLWIGLVVLVRGRYLTALGLGVVGFMIGSSMLFGMLVAYDFDGAEPLIGSLLWLGCSAMLGFAAVVCWRKLPVDRPRLIVYKDWT